MKTNKEFTAITSPYKPNTYHILMWIDKMVDNIGTIRFLDGSEDGSPSIDVECSQTSRFCTVPTIEFWKVVLDKLPSLIKHPSVKVVNIKFTNDLSNTMGYVDNTYKKCFIEAVKAVYNTQHTEVVSEDGSTTTIKVKLPQTAI